jgi:acyl-CoA dehydrogenase
MINHATTELFFDDLEVPAENLIGEEGKGFPLHPRRHERGAHPDRGECIGDGRFFIDRAAPMRGSVRSVRPRRSARTRACSSPSRAPMCRCRRRPQMVDKAAALFDASEPCGTEANMAKLLASEASWFAADMCVQTHGGFGFAEEFDIERKFRETRLYQVAPISTNLILSHVATHVLDLPKSF